jgi:serine/threonine-protein kinase HipA
MRLAAECGLDVPNLGFEQALGRDIYLIERFDRTPTHLGMLRRPFASGLTLLGAHERDVGRHSYADLAGALRQLGAEPRRDLTELYRRMVFNILVTNDDDHLRNHGFLFDATGWRLSPLYDVVPKPQIGREPSLVLGVGPMGRAATLENARAGAADFHLMPEEAQAHIDTLVQLVRGRWQDVFAAAGVNAADRRRFATGFRQADPELDALAGPPDAE